MKFCRSEWWHVGMFQRTVPPRPLVSPGMPCLIRNARWGLVVLPGVLWHRWINFLHLPWIEAVAHDHLQQWELCGGGAISPGLCGGLKDIPGVFILSTLKHIKSRNSIAIPCVVVKVHKSDSEWICHSCTNPNEDGVLQYSSALTYRGLLGMV